MHLLLRIKLLLYFAWGSSAEQHLRVVSTYEAPTTELQHLTLERRLGILYTAGTNVLVQLSSNLDQLCTLRTGPYQDSPECYGPHCTRRAQKQLTANHNKILVIDEQHEELISCGTLFQGSCLTLSLHNISERDSTECQESCFLPVASNTKEASTVAFIGPGPRSTADEQNQVLYVGVSYTQNGPFRTGIPAVSSRSLQPDRKLYVEEYGTAIKILSEEEDRYPVNYIYGFSSQGFSYFLTTQKTSNASSSPYVSKLVRVCQRDANYYSYTEIPIECKAQDGESYNLAQAAFLGKAGSHVASWLDTNILDDILFAVFAKGEKKNVSKPVNESALCVYSLKYIRQKFTENIQNCFNGMGKRGLEFLLPERTCHKTRFTIDDDFCGMDVNSLVGGDIPVTQAAVITQPVLFTAVAATPSEKSTLVFLGTSQGRLKKVAIDDKAIELEEVTIEEGATIMPDLVFDRGEKHLFALTGRTVNKIRINDCGILTTCEQCSSDPYCGWCSAEGRCTQRDDCVAALVSQSNGRCPVITAVTPALIPRGFGPTVKLTTSQLPILKNPIQCVFTTGDTVLTTTARQTNDFIGCETNSAQFWSSANLPQGHLNATLSVRQIFSKHDLLTTTVVIFDCSSFSSCSSCSSSTFPCVWHVDEHRCSSTHETRDNVIDRIHRKSGKNEVTGPSFCPRILSFSTGSTEVLLHLGQQQTLQVKVENIDKYNLSLSSFSCQLTTENDTTIVPASYSEGVVSCDSMAPDYVGDSPTLVTDFDILWDKDKRLEKPNVLRVLTYDCGLLAKDCDTCSTLDSKYDCGWCESSQKCTTFGQCEASTERVDSALRWFHANETCPVEIFDFVPKREPMGGKVNVSVTGRNFGSLEDISIAGLPCNIQQNLSNPSTVVCLLNAQLNNKEEILGPVRIRNRRSTGESVDLFLYTVPRIESIAPLKGPTSGGILITVFGRNLDSGINAEAWIDPDLRCSIIFRNSTHVLCNTSPSEHEVSGHFNLVLDGAVQKYSESTFTYFSDPVVHQIECSATGTYLKQPRISVSGGNRLQVFGQGFKNVDDPVMSLRVNESLYNTSCLVKDDLHMECVTPSLQVKTLNNVTEPVKVEVGFSAFGKPMQSDSKAKHLLLYTDPYIEPPPGGMYELAREFLIVNGKGFDHVCQGDLNITVANFTCDMTKVSSNQLVCQLPIAEMKAQGIENNLAIEVILGLKLKTVGSLTIPVAQEGRTLQDIFWNPNSLVIYVATGILVLGLLIIALVIKLNNGNVCIFMKKTKSKAVGNIQTREVKLSRDGGQGRNPASTLLRQCDELVSILDYQDGEFSPISSTRVNLKFPRDKLTALDESDKLGSGFSGSVYRATATGLFPSKEREQTLVAVKTVRELGDAVTLKALRTELGILAELDPHPHVLKLLGACTDNLRKEKPLLLLEYCPLGSLKDFLIKNKDSFVRVQNNKPLMIADSEDSSGYEIPIYLRNSYLFNCRIHSENEFCSRDLLLWAGQIASGMEHLTMHKVLHGDLAARNILLSSERQVKIADFGLARDMYCSGLYQKTGDGPLPFKWLAPESLRSQQFTSQTDVWSFGVLLWELYSLGNEPYPGFGPGEEFVRILETGYRLSRPELASDHIYDLMKKCWSWSAEHRPTFTQLRQTLGSQLIQLSVQMNG